jgi:hypothetical protein
LGAVSSSSFASAGITALAGDGSASSARSGASSSCASEPSAIASSASANSMSSSMGLLGRDAGGVITPSDMTDPRRGGEGTTRSAAGAGEADMV